MVDAAAPAGNACGIEGSISNLVEILKAIDRGETVCTSFMSRSEVNDFCLAAGFSRLWGSMIESEIACQPDTDFCKGINTPRVVPMAC